MGSILKETMPIKTRNRINTTEQKKAGLNFSERAERKKDRLKKKTKLKHPNPRTLP